MSYYLSSKQQRCWSDCADAQADLHLCCSHKTRFRIGERGGSVVECRTPEREVRGSRPTAAVLCPWARHFTPRKYWLITQEAMAPSRHDWKIVDWDVKPQHNQRFRMTWPKWAFAGHSGMLNYLRSSVYVTHLTLSIQLYCLKYQRTRHFYL